MNNQRNHVELTGFVHHAKQFGKNGNVIRFKLENEISADGENQRTRKNWIDCVVFDATDKLLRDLNHGTTPLVKLEGHLQSSSFKDKSNQRVYRLDVVVAPESIELKAD